TATTRSGSGNRSSCVSCRRTTGRTLVIDLATCRKPRSTSSNTCWINANTILTTFRTETKWYARSVRNVTLRAKKISTCPRASGLGMTFLLIGRCWLMEKWRKRFAGARECRAACANGSKPVGPVRSTAVLIGRCRLIERDKVDARPAQRMAPIAVRRLDVLVTGHDHHVPFERVDRLEFVRR